MLSPPPTTRSSYLVWPTTTGLGMEGTSFARTSSGTGTRRIILKKNTPKQSSLHLKQKNRDREIATKPSGSDNMKAVRARATFLRGKKGVRVGLPQFLGK